MVEWQNTVDAIYRCMKSGLISVWHFGMGYDDETSFLEGIRTHDPFARGEGGLIWYGLFLTGTDKLRELVARHLAPPADDVRVKSAFIDELEHIFDESGVAWSKLPLSPVDPTAR